MIDDHKEQEKNLEKEDQNIGKKYPEQKEEEIQQANETFTSKETKILWLSSSHESPCPVIRH